MKLCYEVVIHYEQNKTQLLDVHSLPQSMFLKTCLMNDIIKNVSFKNANLQNYIATMQSVWTK